MIESAQEPSNNDLMEVEEPEQQESEKNLSPEEREPEAEVEISIETNTEQAVIGADEASAPVEEEMKEHDFAEPNPVLVYAGEERTPMNFEGKQSVCILSNLTADEKDEFKER